MPWKRAFDHSLDLLRIDFAPTERPPTTARVLVATLVSLLGSLVADAVLVAIGEVALPSTKGYVHFQFGDYSKLTVIGVIIACAAWPIVTRISSAPRWLFFRLAIVVTLVLLLPGSLYLEAGSTGRGGGRPDVHAPGDRVRHLHLAGPPGARACPAAA